MRIISSVLTAFAFALSANAISSECQGISAPVAACNNQINDMTKELPTVVKMLSSFTSADGIEGGLNIYNVVDPILKLMEAGREKCCADFGAVTIDDVQSMVDTISAILSHIVTSLDITSKKKGEFDQLVIATDIAKDTIKGLYRGTKAIATCISNAGSTHQPSFIPIIDDYVSQIDNAFLRAKKVYDF